MPGGIRPPRRMHARPDHLRERHGRPPVAARRARQQPLRDQVVPLLPRLPGGGGEELLGHERGVRRRGRGHHGRLHRVQGARRVHRVQEPRAPRRPPLRGKPPHTAGHRGEELRQDGRGAEGRGLRHVLRLRRLAQIGHGFLRAAPLRRHEPGGLQVGRGERRRHRRRGGEPAGRSLRLGRERARRGARLLGPHPVLLRPGRHLHTQVLGGPGLVRQARPPSRRRSRATSFGGPATSPSTWAATSTSTSRSPATYASARRESPISRAPSDTDSKERECERKTG